MPIEPQKTLEQIKAEFNAAQEKMPRTTTPTLSEVGKQFLANALRDNPQAPGEGVRDGNIQDGEFD